MKSLLSLFALASLAFYISCDKADEIIPKSELDKLPPVTQEGKNTFGCLVNGRSYFNTNSSKMHAIYQGGGMQFGSKGEGDLDVSINFVLLDPLDINKKYFLTNVSSHRAKVQSILNETICWYESDDTYEGSLVFLKIDRTNYIVSGTFEFSTVTEECDTLKITQGRFDIQYVP